MTGGDEEPLLFDEDFVRAAAVREDNLYVLPTRASVREVKREARQRRRASGRISPRGGRWQRIRARAASLLVVAAVIAGGALYLSRLPGPPPKRRTAPIVVPSYSPPPKNGDVFAGSPVARWPVGAAGIRPPVAAPVGTYSAAQVADAYARTAALVRAALLDPDVLYREQTAPVLGMLVPKSAGHWRNKLPYMMNRFDPRAVMRASDTVRVNGRMSATRGDHGSLRVSVSYVAVYALRPVTEPSTPELVAVRRVAEFEYGLGADARHVSAPWARGGTYVSDHSRCGQSEPNEAFVTVFFATTEASARATNTTAPTENFNVLDPTATLPPTTCFDDTSGL